MRKYSFSRREFMQIGAGAAAAGVAAKVTLLEPQRLWASAGPVPPSDTVRFGIIGTGTEGCDLLRATLAVPGIECVMAADLYDSRHIAAKEALGGKEIETTRDYRRVLDRKDIDAVIVATPDHWHRKAVTEAVAAGKDVYCEKPMSHSPEDGFAMVDAVHKYNRVLQVGSQRVSSILYAKAKEIWDSGKLGEVDTIEAVWDRNTDSGAWVYPIPPDASEQTIDWKTWLDGAPERPFDPTRFFRWRCYKDYGAGLAGDLFVHLLSGIHFVTGTQHAAPACSVNGRALLLQRRPRVSGPALDFVRLPALPGGATLQPQQQLPRRAVQFLRQERYHAHQSDNGYFPATSDQPSARGLFDWKLASENACRVFCKMARRTSRADAGRIQGR